jgi:Uma2 family endonuclease
MGAGGILMSTAPTRRISPQEYLAQERLADFRSEYLHGQMFPMSRSSFQHTLIKGNLAGEAGNQLESGSCHVLTSDMRVRVNATGFYTYPNIAIVCDEPQFEDAAVDTLLNPRVIVEVLSDSTEKYDRGAKFAHYRQVPSLQEYILVAQDRPLVERYVRQADGSWLLTVFDKPDQVFAFASVPVRVPLTEIYRGVKLAENTGARQQ